MLLETTPASPALLEHCWYYDIRGVRDTRISMGPMGIPWEWEAQTECMGMETGMGIVDEKCE